MLETEKAYIAGIIDGEGNINISKFLKSASGCINPSYESRLIITNTDLKLLTWMKEKIGCGKILIRKKIKEHHKQSFALAITGNMCKNVLLAVYPYLLIKKDQADIIFEERKLAEKNFSASKRFGTSKEILEQRENLFKKLKELHHHQEKNEIQITKEEING